MERMAGVSSGNQSRHRNVNLTILTFSISTWPSFVKWIDGTKWAMELEQCLIEIPQLNYLSQVDLGEIQDVEGDEWNRPISGQKTY